MSLSVGLSNLLIIISSILTIVSVFPYLISVIKHKTRPRVVTWFTWGLLTGISCVASVVEGQWATAIMLGFAAAENLLIMALGWKYGEKQFEKLDIVCLVGVITGIVAWATLDSPAAAVLVMIATDFIGGLPTLTHAYKKPHEENWSTFAMLGAASFCTLLAIQVWQITSFAYPLFIFLNCVTITTVILFRRSQKIKTR